MTDYYRLVVLYHKFAGIPLTSVLKYLFKLVEELLFHGTHEGQLFFTLDFGEWGYLIYNPPL